MAETKSADGGAEPIDVVYTWVDGAFPGYNDLLNRYAKTKHDLNPNRYRDNLDVMKYSLRSLVKHMPWFRHLYLVGTRPQIPDWIDPSAEGLTIVYHDEFFPPEHVPTFNSFAIVSNLYKLAGVSRRFLYLEDDRLFMRATERSDYFAADGRIKIYEKFEGTDDASGYADPTKSPWEAALAYSNHLLNERYGKVRRGSVKHAPMLIDTELFAEFAATWPEDIERTSASRFRSRMNIPSEHMFPHYLVHEDKGVRAPKAEAYCKASYLGIENQSIIDFFGLTSLKIRRPNWYALNDNFGERPNPRVVHMVKRFLEESYSEPSRFERVTS